MINVEYLKTLDPCADRYENFLKHYASFEGTLEEFLDLEHLSHNDKMWVSFRYMDKKSSIEASCQIAESVLYIFESRSPDDKRPREAINATRLGSDVSGHAAATNAAYAAAYGAYADAAAINAAYAAYGAPTYATATNAAYAAAYAANADAYAAINAAYGAYTDAYAVYADAAAINAAYAAYADATNAAYAAVYAAYAANGEIAKEKQQKKNIEIIKSVCKESGIVK